MTDALHYLFIRTHYFASIYVGRDAKDKECLLSVKKIRLSPLLKTLQVLGKFKNKTFKIEAEAQERRKIYHGKAMLDDVVIFNLEINIKDTSCYYQEIIFMGIEDEKKVCFLFTHKRGESPGFETLTYGGIYINQKKILTTPPDHQDIKDKWKYFFRPFVPCKYGEMKSDIFFSLDETEIFAICLCVLIFESVIGDRLWWSDASLL